MLATTTGARSRAGSYGSLAYRKGASDSGPLKLISSVWPSGADCAPAAVATVPPPAGRLSITTGWPKASRRRSPITRATTSSELPGPAATRKRSGREGQSWAPAAPGSAQSSSSAAGTVRTRAPRLADAREPVPEPDSGALTA